jgi:murein DD-endopeptidase MepM/ murein hydrolase activator NlpD
MGQTLYLVQQGDTLSAIAKKFDLTVARIVDHNPAITDANRIRSGWHLRIPSKTQNPKVTTLYGGPKDLGSGAVEWFVEFELPEPAGADGWIVQRVLRSYDIRNADGSVWDATLQGPKPEYWEAWPVKKGQVKTATRTDPTAQGVTYDDEFDQPKRPGTRGVFSVHTIVKFYELDALPTTFKTQNPATRAEDLPSTTFRPGFWNGSGTVRDFKAAWDATDGPSPSQINWMVRSIF